MVEDLGPTHAGVELAQQPVLGMGEPSQGTQEVQPEACGFLFNSEGR